MFRTRLKQPLQKCAQPSSECSEMGFKKPYNSIHNLHVNVQNRCRSQTNLTNFHTVPNPKDKTNIHVRFRDANLKPWESSLLTKPHECAGCCCIKLIIEKYRLTKFQFKKPNINTLEKRKKTLYLLQKRELTKEYTQFSTPGSPKNHRPR
jgi:hypothetical protein